MEKTDQEQAKLDQDYRPKAYSPSQNLIMTIKVLAGAAVIGGILWAIHSASA